MENTASKQAQQDAYFLAAELRALLNVIVNSELQDEVYVVRFDETFIENAETVLAQYGEKYLLLPKK